MKWCQEHWDAMKEKVRELGMWHLVAPNAEAAIEAMKEDIEAAGEHRESKAAFDPLMSAFWAINGRALAMGGLYIMSEPVCPLCELDKHAPSDAPIPEGFASHAAAWIDGCMRAQREGARNRGELPREQ